MFQKVRPLSTSVVSWILTLTLVSSLAFGQTNPCEKVQEDKRDSDRWTKILEKDPTNVTALVWRGRAYLSAGNAGLARKDLEKAIELDQTSGHAFEARGDLEMTLGRYEAAVSDFSRSIQFNPISSSAYYSRGRAQDLLERKDLALSDFRMSIDLANDNFIAYAAIGNVYAGRREKDLGSLWLNRAIEILDEKIKRLDPRKCNSNIHLVRGFTATVAGRYNDAFRDLNTSIEMDGLYAESHYRRGRVFYHVSAFANALKDIDRAIELDPIRAELYDFRARVYDRLNNKQAAEADRAKIKELGEIK